MRTLFTLVLLGALQVIPAQENPGSSTGTNSAGVAAHLRIIKRLKWDVAPDSGRRKVPKVERPEDAKYGTLSLSRDAKAQTLGAYDRTVTAAVKNRWSELQDNIEYDGSSTGKVVLQFQALYDGRITGLKVAESSVGEMLGLLCQKAVLDSSPLPRWPKEMHKLMAADSRTMTLTFNYLPDEAHRKR